MSSPADPAELWKQILAAPADADLQARYVESLAAAGDWRADVFSVAAEYQRLVAGSYIDKAAALKPTLDELLARRRADFAPRTATWPGTIEFVLGWPIELTIKAADFARSAAEIVATLPVRHLNLEAVSELPAVFNVPQLDQIASIDGAEQTWSDDAIRALAGSQQLRALRWLRLSHGGITESQVEMLAASQPLRSVRVLILSDNPTRDPVDAAAGAGWDMMGKIVLESIYLPPFGNQLEARYGRIFWLHGYDNYLDDYPPSRHDF